MRIARSVALATIALAASAGLALAAGRLVAAPAPGPAGPEGVPIPKGPILARAQPVRLGQTIQGVTCESAEKVAFHVHAHLTIFVRGKSYKVPYGIGIGPPLGGVNTPAGPFVESGSCFMWLHTHVSDGIIHMEAPRQQVFTLGQFFAIWGAKLSAGQVGRYKGKVTTFYNGKVWKGNPAKLPLSGELQVQLDVGSPVIAPEHITFPTGLRGTS
jgi:hypothetical protein